MLTQLILIISGFHSCEFTYLLKFISNPKINTHDMFTVICGHAQVHLLACFSSHPVNKCPFRGLLSAILVLFLFIVVLSISYFTV